MTESKKAVVMVAGDVCLDIVGIPVPGVLSAPAETDNWRLTGEIRTHYLPGGAFQLAEFVRASCADLEVRAPSACRPYELTCAGKPDQAMSMDEFLGIAERLTRDEIVHSMLHLGVFKGTPDSKKPDTIRVNEPHGFSGPRDDDPSMKILPPGDPDSVACMVVLDDTGNRFRRSPEQWPAVVSQPPTANPPVLVYKLHRPLPDGKVPNQLWNAVMANHAARCVVIVSVDDLRDRDAPISRGLSWERTALDLIWQLLHSEAFAALRDCPHLVVRLGLDGALYWRCSKGENDPQYQAWLFYDPAGIEGSGVNACPGRMVGYASAFTAALASHLAVTPAASCLLTITDADGNGAPPPAIAEGIKAGLTASRRLLALGFGKDVKPPAYPKAELFAAGDKDPFFACRLVPIIPGANVADRGYWRLLESIFSGKTSLLQRAVAMTATGARAVTPEDKDAAALLKQVPSAVFAKALRAIDRCEIENYRALYSLLRDYISMPTANRPLSVAVFGPPGAGKSFGVKKVAKALGELGGKRPIEEITFNLSQYQKAGDLADAFHLVRDIVLRGRIPLVFFDEFDTSLEDKPLGWLRYFLAPMQDGEFLDRGSPHPIGQAIFVFAGGTSFNYADFAKPFIAPCPGQTDGFQKAKGPDFLSRLRATLDIPGLDLETEFDAFGPVAAFPSEPAILLRRASIFAYQMGEKAPHLRDASGAFRVSDSVLRALLHLPKFVHGNRSFEAMLDMSHFQGADQFNPALLPAPGHTALHANATYLSQFLATEYPFPSKDRDRIAQDIHEHFVEQRKAKGEYKPAKASHQAWDKLDSRYVNSNREQADAIANKLRSVGLWLRKRESSSAPSAGSALLTPEIVDRLARMEHDRWVVEIRRLAFEYAPEAAPQPAFTHHCILKWDDPRLTQAEKDKDIDSVKAIPRYLAAAGYEIIQTEPGKG
jgi:hypothetical protein